MRDDESVTPGLGDVFRLALQDRFFLKRLLDDPREAIELNRSQGNLGRVTDEDVERVERIVAESDWPRGERLDDLLDRLGRVVEWEPPPWPKAMWPSAFTLPHEGDR